MMPYRSPGNQVSPDVFEQARAWYEPLGLYIRSVPMHIAGQEYLRLSRWDADIPSLKGRTRCDSVVETDLFKPGTPELACTGYSERTSGPGGETHYYIGIYDTTTCGRKADAGAGAMGICAVAPGQLRSQAVGHERYGDPELEERHAERFASTHAVRVQNRKLCMRAKRSSALRKF
eukprot:6202330-Pleurochrysis_carterae.AAC.2